ncbi:low-density lipoprotein receptor class a domain-containing protein 3 [Plakobranchus ocellatus]|uniref:Low-density lipoprotein receptor class a domain-containing protein 3 n=1 Tax=Plakobranchus ocellatus TaxID=259542 RepID=A0AAV4D8M9_9GAST|nr:low-density lipoprotein receptor class a domain-containing protein 3 [Plakobranchus ocellatus]
MFIANPRQNDLRLSSDRPWRPLRGMNPRQKDPYRSQGGFAIHRATRKPHLELVPDMEKLSGRLLSLQKSKGNVSPALPRTALPCPAMPSLPLPRHALPCPALPRTALPCPAMPSLPLSRTALPCPALPRTALPCPAMPSLPLPRHALP